MSAKQHLQTAAVQVLASEGLLRTRRRLAEMKRQVMGQEHTVTYYHRVDDPYAHLLVQVLPAFLDAYDVAFRHRLVPAPEDEMAPEPELLGPWELADAIELARYYDVTLEASACQPAKGLVGRANAILAGIDDPRVFVTAADEVGRAVWAGDDGALASLAERYGTADDSAVARTLADGAAELIDRGHYFGATLHYGGEGYWGIERLRYLEDRLGELGLRHDGAAEHAVRLRPAQDFPGDEVGDVEVTLDYYVSFRSPYTYLSLNRVLDLVERYPVRLNVKPVLPMLMRGLPVPKRKAMYILGDVAREARRLGIPFGNWADPLGPGVERWMAVYPYAKRADKVIEYLRATFGGVWTEAIDAATDNGLRTMVERAGLDWTEAEAMLGDASWRGMAARNQADLNAAGLWGVPSFVVGPYAAWGQDRLWIVEEKLKAHFG
jgi:2-hydroxychromene-2-carboxylate isomerase